MDEILKALLELEADDGIIRGRFMGLMIVNEEAFFRRTQLLREKLTALDKRSSRDVLAQALLLSHDERRQLAESLLRE